MHSAGYEALGIDFTYMAFGVSDIEGAIAGVRALGIRGCSVSMPFKEAVVPLLDQLDDRARDVGAVNTIVNDEGWLAGTNTDVDGARVSLEHLGVGEASRVVLLGAGGAAKAIIFALRELSVASITAVCRSAARRADMERSGVHACAWEERNGLEADVLINATPIGMRPHEESPIAMDRVKAFGAVMDVVVAPAETVLIAAARHAGVQVARGDLMVLHQAAEQFRLYTGREAPLTAMERALQEALGAS